MSSDVSFWFSVKMSSLDIKVKNLKMVYLEEFRFEKSRILMFFLMINHLKISEHSQE